MTCVKIEEQDGEISSRLYSLQISVSVHRTEVFQLTARHQCSIVDLRPKGPRIRWDHYRVGELHYWLCHPCLALDLAVQFKLWSGIGAWTQIWVHVQLDSSGPHWTEWADHQHSQAWASVRALPLPTIIIFTNPSAQAGYDTRPIFLSGV